MHPQSLLAGGFPNDHQQHLTLNTTPHAIVGCVSSGETITYSLAILPGCHLIAVAIHGSLSSHGYDALVAGIAGLQ